MNDQVEEIEDTLKSFADACNWINQNTLSKLRNKVRIQGIGFKCATSAWAGDAVFNCAQNIAFLSRYVDRPGGSDLATSFKAVLSRATESSCL